MADLPKASLNSKVYNYAKEDVSLTYKSFQILIDGCIKQAPSVMCSKNPFCKK